MSLKYFSIFLRTIEMLLINCEVNVFLTWSEKCIIVPGNYGNREPKWAKTDTRLYVPVVTLSAQNNEKLLHRLKIAFKKTINWNKYQSEPTLQTLKTIFKSPDWSKCSESKNIFCFIIWKWCICKKLQATFSSDYQYFGSIWSQYKMTQYNNLNIKLSNSQLNKLKSGITNGTEVSLKLSLNVFGDSNDENNFLHKVLLTDTRVSRLSKALANNSSANIKLSKNWRMFR